MRNIFKKFRKNPIADKDQAVVKELVEEGNSHLKQLQQIDQEISAIQRSTKTTFSFFAPVHNYCRTKYSWYYNWHTKPFATKIHAGVLTMVLLVSLAIGSYSILGRPRLARAADYTCTFTNGSGDNYWDTSDNWSDCGVDYPGMSYPTFSYDVIIPAGQTVNLDTLDVDITADGAVEGDVSVSGTLNLLNGGDLTLVSMTINSGGTVNAGASNINVKANWDNINGTFTSNTSTVNFTGTGTINVGASPSATGKPFNNITVAPSGGTTTLDGGGIWSTTATVGAGTLSSASGTKDLTLRGTGTSLTNSQNGTFSGVRMNFAQVGDCNIPAATNYYMIWIHNSGVAGSSPTSTLLGDVTVSSYVYISGGSANNQATLDLNGYDFNSGTILIGQWWSEPSNALGKIKNSAVSESVLTSQGTITFRNGSSTYFDPENTIDGTNMRIVLPYSMPWDNNDDTNSFQASDSTITLTAVSDQNLYLGVGVTFNNLTINNTGVSGSDDIIFHEANLDIDGKLTITDGDLDLATNNPNATLGGGLEFSHATNGSLTRGTGTLTFDGAGTWMDNGTDKRDLGNVSGTAAVTLGSSVKATDALMTSLDISGYTITITGSSSMRPLDTTTLTYNASSEIIYTSSSADTIRLPEYTNPSVTINGASGLTLKPEIEGTEPIIEGNLTITSGIFNTQDADMTDRDLTINGNLTLGADGTLTVNSSTIEVTGNWDTSAGMFIAGSSNVTLSKSASTQTFKSAGAGQSFNNITHSGAGTLQLVTNNLDVNGNFENSAGTFDANNLNLNVAKNFAVSGGSFSPKVGGGATTQTVTLDSTNTTIVSGSTTFNHLTIDSSADGAKTASFDFETTQTVAGTLTLTGGSGKVLTLQREGGIAGQHWNLAISGDMTSGQYIAVSDNNVTGGTITPGSYVNVTDGGNNHGWAWDSTSPVVTVTKNPVAPNGDNGWYITVAPTVTITADDGVGIGVDKIYYRWGAIGSYAEYTIPLTAPEGSNALYSYATDLIGNSGVDSPDIQTIKVDLTAPDVTAIMPFTTTPTNNLAVTFHWTEATDASSGIDNYFVYIGTTPDGIDIENGTSASPNSFLKTFSAIGTYYIRIKAKDLAGNVSGTFSGEGSVLIENNPPDVAIINLINNQYVNTKEFTILGTASDAIAGLSRVYINLDSGSWIETSSSDGYNNWSYLWSGYGDGLHTIVVKAVDASGNIKESTSYAVMVDTVAPTQTSGFRLFNVGNSFAQVYATYLDFAGSTDDTSGVATYELWKGSTKLSDIPTAKDISNKYYTGNPNQSYFYLDPDLSPSSYSYYIKSIDNAGNSSQTPTLTIDTNGKTVETDAITEAKGTPSSVVTKQKTSALISWDTVYPATSSVEYGESTNYGKKATLDPNLNLGHSVLIPDLKPATLYHAKVTSRDIYGRELSSPDFTFQTNTSPDDKTVLQIIIESLKNLFRAVTAKGAPAIITTGTPTTEELSSLQGFSNNLMVTDVSLPDRNYYTNILTFEKGKTPERSTDNTSYQALPAQSNNYIIDRDLTSTTTYYYRLDQGNPIVRKPVLGDDSPLTIKDPQVIKESVMSGKDKAQLTVSWTTNRGSTSSVEFGSSLAYGQKTKDDASLNMGHNILIEDLTPDSTYHFKVTSTDAQSSTATSQDFTFQTPKAQTEKGPIDIIIEALNKVFSTVKSYF